MLSPSRREAETAEDPEDPDAGIIPPIMIPRRERNGEASCGLPPPVRDAVGRGKEVLTGCIR